MTTKRQVRILSVTQKMKQMAGGKVQSVNATISELEKKRDSIILWISQNNFVSQVFSAQMEKNLTNISIELQSLVNKKNELVRESVKLMEQESIAAERLKSLQYGVVRKQNEEECLDWVSHKTVAGRKPGTGL